LKLKNKSILTMIFTKRQNEILELLKLKRTCSVREINKTIAGSSSTIQRQLTKLEDLGYISRIHGAVVLTDNNKPEHNLDSRLARNSDKKIIIAKKAIEIIEDETSIFLDHSSTCAYLALEIEKRRFKHIVLVTNSLWVAIKLENKRNIDLILAGGELQHSWGATKGPHALDTISKFNFDQSFISCGMFSIERGARTNYFFVSEITKKACDSALETNLLIDSSKFVKAGAFLIKKAKDFTRIISDTDIYFKKE